METITFGCNYLGLGLLSVLLYCMAYIYYYFVNGKTVWCKSV